MTMTRNEHAASFFVRQARLAPAPFFRWYLQLDHKTPPPPPFFQIPAGTPRRNPRRRKCRRVDHPCTPRTRCAANKTGTVACRTPRQETSPCQAIRCRTRRTPVSDCTRQLNQRPSLISDTRDPRGSRPGSRELARVDRDLPFKSTRTRTYLFLGANALARRERSVKRAV